VETGTGSLEDRSGSFGDDDVDGAQMRTVSARSGGRTNLDFHTTEILNFA